MTDKTSIDAPYTYSIIGMGTPNDKEITEYTIIIHTTKGYVESFRNLLSKHGKET